MVKPILLQTDGTTSRPLTRSSLRNGEVRLANPTGITRSRRPPTARAPAAAVRNTGSSDGQLAGMAVIAPPPPPPGPEPSVAPQRDPPQPAAAPAVPTRPCIFCQLKKVPVPSMHPPEHCPVVPLPNIRKNLLMKVGLCFRCLYETHSGRTNHCPGQCSFCQPNGRDNSHAHHTALCRRR